MADYSFYEYQRLVQKEAEPDLIVHLPDRSDDAAQANVPQPEVESEDATMQAHVELAVTVAFEIHQPKCGLRFHGAYAYTDNQVQKCWRQRVMLLSSLRSISVSKMTVCPSHICIWKFSIEVWPALNGAYAYTDNQVQKCCTH